MQGQEQTTIILVNPMRLLFGLTLPLFCCPSAHASVPGGLAWSRPDLGCTCISRAQHSCVQQLWVFHTCQTPAHPSQRYCALTAAARLAPNPRYPAQQIPGLSTLRALPQPGTLHAPKPGISSTSGCSAMRKLPANLMSVTLGHIRVFSLHLQRA